MNRLDDAVARGWRHEVPELAVEEQLQLSLSDYALCSYLYGSLYGGLYERAHIIRYFYSRIFGAGVGLADVVDSTPDELEPGAKRNTFS